MTLPTAKELRENKQIEHDLELAKMYFLRAKHPHMKQAYYKLWYAILVIKHKEEPGTRELKVRYDI